MARGSEARPATDGAAAHAKEAAGREQELAATVERYELIWKATHDIVYDLDLLTGTVVWNAALNEQFGYSTRERSSTLEWWVAHIHLDDALKVERGLYDWFAGNSDTWRSEYRFRKANGSYAYVLDRGYVQRAGDGSPIRVIGTLFDITEQKRLERAKDEFISLVSHQLRTPLTVIRVYGEMFTAGLLGRLTRKQSANLNRMTDASIRLIKLVDDILDVSRIELGDYEIRRAWVNLNNIVQHCLDEVKLLAEGKRIDLTFTPDPQHPWTYTDPDVLGQILDNLLTNAIRYTLPERGVISVRSMIAGDRLMIIVQDNGIGIPRSAQKRVFERFFRAHNAVNIEEHGTGLGLYLVHVLTNALGGRVWFESSRRTGTTFYLSLPID